MGCAYGGADAGGVDLIRALPGGLFLSRLRRGGGFYFPAAPGVLVLLFNKLLPLPGRAYFSPARKVAKARQNLRFWIPL